VPVPIDHPLDSLTRALHQPLYSNNWNFFFMLVLTRRFGESIRIGDDIRVTIIERDHNHQVRVGIEAPNSISILREELYERSQLGEGQTTGELVKRLRENHLPVCDEAADEIERAESEIQRLRTVLKAGR